ncbi:hypothetical protein RAE21_19055 [Rhodoferax sp. TBRC 17198]|uniref:hypothetical protein n=1 Tax=Rhodoferax potami TaxID=3068338 RepID=UPI0028BF1C09|nr:hypothetical protein [Rhodoferax sp. TBRC 17198]MDT7524449.1 hypothetical protein [Rhodoferax sp. TBRC 17198]
MALFNTYESTPSSAGAGVNIGSVYSVLTPMLQTISERFRDRLQQIQGQGEMSSQDLLVVQRETAEMAETTQLTSELMKSLRDMVSSVLKNVA